MSKRNKSPVPTDTALGLPFTKAFQTELDNMFGFTEAEGAVRITVETSAPQAESSGGWKRLTLVLKDKKSGTRKLRDLIPSIANIERIPDPTNIIEFNGI